MSISCTLLSTPSINLFIDVTLYYCCDLITVILWRQEEKGMTEDEMVGWHHWFDGHEFGKVLGVGDGQGSLAGCSPWGRQESDTTERLNWTELMSLFLFHRWVHFCHNLDPTCKWYHMVFVFLRLTYLIEHNVLKVHSYRPFGRFSSFHTTG